tara:strand:- start:3868 stop:4569 length:702 start_codon:yes stop_codon:yes gene_type:complete
MKYVTIIIPVYNEINYLESLINKVLKQNKINKQIIVVDDKSIDGTRELIKNKIEILVDKVIYHEFNLGKGSAIQSAKPYINGDIVIIQDGDLEYDPRDYEQLIYPIISNKSKVVYGSRVLGKQRYKLKNFTSVFRIFCNHILTIFSNVINNQNLTDSHTCYKVFDSHLFKNINLFEKRFGFCPEITTKIANRKINILEVPISYSGREYSDGKKISFLDGIRAIYCLIKYKLVK